MYPVQLCDHISSECPAMTPVMPVPQVFVSVAYARDPKIPLFPPLQSSPSNPSSILSYKKSLDPASENITCPKASCDALTKVIDKTEGSEEARLRESLLDSLNSAVEMLTLSTTKWEQGEPRWTLQPMACLAVSCPGSSLSYTCKPDLRKRAAAEAH
ncbi:hypothetical protein STEG23_029951 [Scotinomys teguina]